MKKKLKEFSADVKAAKAAWLAARTAKKPEAEVKPLLETYQKNLALMDQFIEDGKKDEDEVEIPAEKSANDVVELGELGESVAKHVKAALDSKLGELSSKQLTEDVVKKIVADAIKDSKKSELELSDKDVKSIAEAAMTKALKGIKVPSKMKGILEDAKRGGVDKAVEDEDGENELSVEEKKAYGMIETPESLTKGNLPLHMKQLANCLLRKPQDQDIPESMIRKGEKLADYMFNAMQVQGFKALTTGGTGTGAEWIPRNLSSELYRRLYLSSQIAMVMQAREIAMPTDPYDLPFSTTRPTFYRNRVQNRDARGSTPGSAKITMQTQKLMALVQYSYEANEDAIIPILPLLETLIGEAAAAAYESALINGDTTATHQDSDVTDPDDVRTSWNGFRKLAIAAGLKIDFSTGGITRANLLALKKKLSKWGIRPSDLMWIVPSMSATEFLGLDDVVNVNVHGADATHISGVLPGYFGTPIVTSEQAREDLNALGVYDGVTQTKGGILLVNHTQFVTGVRREFTIEVDRNIRSQTNDIVASFRKAFNPTDTPSASIKTLAYGYNYNI